MRRRRDVREKGKEIEPPREDVELYGGGGGGKAGKKKKRWRSEFIDDLAEEEGEYRVGKGRVKRRSGSMFIDDIAEVDDEEEEEEEEEDGEEAEDDFIVDNSADILEKDDDRVMHRHPLLDHEDDEEEDMETLKRRLQERYGNIDVRYDEEPTEVEQQALLPSNKDPKLWRVTCVSGHEREVAVCLMQKYIDNGSELKIRSVIALDHLKNFIYVEADKVAHVREACKGLHNINANQIRLVPIMEMTDVLSVKTKVVHPSKGAWVRMKTGLYKGDLAKVVGVDNVRKRVTVKLFPRIDLLARANKQDGRGVSKKNDFCRAPHSKDGFVIKEVSTKSVNECDIQPTFDELEKFFHLGEIGDGDMANLSTQSTNRKKGQQFFKGNRVIVVKGDLKNLKGQVEKVEEDYIYIKPDAKDLLETLVLSDKELCKYFEPGNQVKIVSGAGEGTTGFVVSLDGPVVNILSDTTKELLCVFADNVVEISGETTGLARIGDYELHNLVQLDNMSFGVIIHMDNESFQVLKGVPGKPVVAVVRPGEIRCKVDGIKSGTKDQLDRILSVNDHVKVVEGQWRGKTGRIAYICKGNLFIYDRCHLEHAGFICAKSQSCILVGGSQATNYSKGQNTSSRSHAHLSQHRSSRDCSSMNSGGRCRGGRQYDALIGTFIKIRGGVYKGHKGRVKEIKGKTIWVELEAQMRVVPVGLDQITDIVNVSTPSWETSRFGLGSDAPVHPSQTPLHPRMTPMRDQGVNDGRRTPVHDMALNTNTTVRVTTGLFGYWG